MDSEDKAMLCYIAIIAVSFVALVIGTNWVVDYYYVKGGYHACSFMGGSSLWCK